MGLIREPKEIDFHVIDSAWNEQELKELSEFIKMRKAERIKIKLASKVKISKQVVV